MADYSSMFDAAQQPDATTTPPAAPAGTNYATMFDTAQGAQQGSDTWAPAIPYVPRLSDMAMGLLHAFQKGSNFTGDVFTGKQPLDLNDPNVMDNIKNIALLGIAPNPAVASGERAIAGAANAGTGSPTRQALYRAATNQYDAFRNSGANLKPEVMPALSDFTSKALANKGITPRTAPGTYELLDGLKNPPEVGGDITNSFFSPGAYQELRQNLGNIAREYVPAPSRDRVAATIALGHLDQLFNEAPPQAFVAGTTPEQIATARTAFRAANGNFGAAERSGAVSTPVNDAEHAALTRNSGQNIGNTIRQRMAGLVRGNDEVKGFVKNKNLRGFTPEELQGVQDIGDGTWLTNKARGIANQFGGGGGLGSFLTHAAGMAGGGLLGHAFDLGPMGEAAGAYIGNKAVGLLGTQSKALENALVRRQAAQLDEALRARSPLAQMGATGPMSPFQYGLKALTPAAFAAWQAQNPNSL